jgi:hypothetical protein
MDTATMLNAAAWLFVLTAAGGLVLATIRLTGKPHPPLFMAMGHGMVACAGLTLLVYALLMGGAAATNASIAAALFVLSAGGGAAMNLLFHSKGLPLPVGLMVAHAALGVAGLFFLLRGLWF